MSEFANEVKHFGVMVNSSFLHFEFRKIALFRNALPTPPIFMLNLKRIGLIDIVQPLTKVISRATDERTGTQVMT